MPPLRKRTVTDNPKKPPPPVRFLKGVGPSRAEILARAGIETIEDLLYHLPRKLEDRSHITPIAQLKINETATICATVADIRAAGGRYRRIHRLMLWLEDESGEIEAVFFNRKYLEDRFEVGMQLVLAGKVKLYQGRGKAVTMQLVSPEFEIVEGEIPDSGAGIVPFYTAPSGLSQQLHIWPTAFCEQLAARGYHVTRFDNRDVGRSTHLRFRPPSLTASLLRRWPPQQYDLSDMAADTAGLLDALGHPHAHLIGSNELGPSIRKHWNHPLRFAPVTARHFRLGVLGRNTYIREFQLFEKE